MILRRPLVVYDGNCGFCKWCVRRWSLRTRGRLDWAPYQEVAEKFPRIPRENFRETVHFITPKGRAITGAEAIFAITRMSGGGAGLWMYRHLPGFAWASEKSYRVVANHRPFFDRTRKIVVRKRSWPVARGPRLVGKNRGALGKCCEWDRR